MLLPPNDTNQDEDGDTYQCAEVTAGAMPVVEVIHDQPK